MPLRKRKLIEIGGCFYDDDLFHRSHGFESLDAVGREAFVNHIHLAGATQETVGNEMIADWSQEMRQKWPTTAFRIYRDVEAAERETIIRFHAVRPNLPNWRSDEEENVVVVNGT